MKPGTFTQLYIQLVFAVKFRDRLLSKEIRENVFKYINGIITNLGHKPIITNGVEDHIHVFIGLNPSKSISETVKEIKRSSSIYINEQSWFKTKFQWQEGYGAFSYSRSHIERVYNYILNQEAHHKKKTFRNEYLEFLDKYEVTYEKRFLFDFFD
jgi:REP element-mobilizing transposase RayT